MEESERKVCLSLTLKFRKSNVRQHGIPFNVKSEPLPVDTIEALWLAVYEIQEMKY